MLFSDLNWKTFPEHADEKIFKIGQAVQKFNLYVNVTKSHAIPIKCMYILSLSFSLTIHKSVNS